MACFGSGLLAQQAFPTVTPFELGYSIRSWTMDDGLKDSYVAGLAHGQDGALLFSDGVGLMRYNGIEFEDLMAKAPPAFPRFRINEIHEDSDGRLWTTGMSGQAMREPDGNWVAMWEDRGGRIGIGKFARGPAGRLWCAVSSPEGSLMVSVYEEERFQPVLEKALPSGFIQALEFDEAGRLWLSVASQGERPSLYRLEENALVPEVGADWSMGTLFRKDGDPRLWLVTREGIRVREEDDWQEVIAFSDALSEGNGFSACAVDADGNYWIATRSLGICVCQPDGRVSRLVSEEVQFPNLITDLFAGRDGTIWFNGENGLLQLRRRPFTLWPQPLRHRRAGIRAIYEDGEGTIWFGGAGIYSLRAGEFVQQHWTDGDARPEVYGMVERPESGALFVNGSGTLSTASARDRRVIARSEGGGGGRVRDLLEHEGTVWVARERGLYRMESGSLVPVPPPDAVPNMPLCLASGSEGELYVGFRKSGLFRYQDSQWSFAGLDGSIEALAVAPDDTLWARRRASELYWLKDGKWYSADSMEMGIGRQFHMVCSREGSIWLRGRRGPVIRVDRSAAEAWLQGDRTVDLQLRTYGGAEGIPVERAVADSGLRTLMEDRQGRIWVATVQGVSAWVPSYDTRSAVERGNQQPIPILIEKVLIDDNPIVVSNDAVTVTPDQNRLEISYAGLDLASPESVLYRYRLEGYQDEWVEAGNRHAAYFQRIPPGSYRFQVIAADRHGVWNEKGAMLTITVLPHWWEHWLFRFGAPIVVVVILLGVIFLRVRAFRKRALERARLQDEFSRGLIEVQEAERTRIAGELHDDLGQDLLVMKSRIDLSRRRAESETEKESLSQLSGSTADVLHKVRTLSHQLRPLHLDHLGLAASIKSLVKEVSEAAKLDYEVEAEDLEQALSPDIKVALYRMLQESLNNVIKHAKASSMKVELTGQGQNVILLISDDGCGFESGTSGHGLRAIKERCTLLEGNLDVISSAGEGTLIRIQIPLKDQGQPRKV